MPKTILIIEDERAGSRILSGHFWRTPDTGLCLRMTARRDWPDSVSAVADLVLLDILLPKINGFAVCEMIRKESSTPVIMLTALDDDFSQMKGFNALADDYITKPFSMPLVVRRIEAVLRRMEKGGAGEEDGQLRYRDLVMDPDNYDVSVGGENVSLTAREFEILRLLLENQGRVFSRDSLLDRIWGYDYFGDEKIVNTHIKNIRRKLGGDYIETVRGVGYRIEKENP